MQKRTPGNSGLGVSAIGYECMKLSALHGQPTPRPDAIRIDVSTHFLPFIGYPRTLNALRAIDEVVPA
jgi:hypothetical protein